MPGIMAPPPVSTQPRAERIDDAALAQAFLDEVKKFAGARLENFGNRAQAQRLRLGIWRCRSRANCGNERRMAVIGT